MRLRIAPQYPSLTAVPIIHLTFDPEVTEGARLEWVEVTFMASVTLAFCMQIALAVGRFYTRDSQEENRSRCTRCDAGN